MALFAHHTDAFLEVEVLGRKFPGGMTEHALVFGLSAVVLGLVAYGAFAAVRDLRRWRRRKLTAA
jgi:hypothetical protein